MHRIKQWGLALALFLGFLSLGTIAAHAQSIDYAALKYGTHQTSMASGYFVHPATVRVQNHAYVVTMDLKTAKKLTSWPVKVLAVDGRAPENVRKVKDSAGNSHVYYSFTTTNLKRNINARLAINVPDVYKAKHKITFRFKTSNLPALNAASRSTQTTTAKTTTQKPVTATEKSARQSAASSSSASQQVASSATAQSKATRSSASQATSSRQATSSSTQPTESAKVADQVPHQKTHWGGLIGGIVAIVVLVGGGSWWYFGRH